MSVDIITTTFRNTEKLKLCLSTVLERTKYIEYKWYIWCNDANDEVKQIVESAKASDKFNHIISIFNTNNDGTFSTTPLVAVFSDGTKSDDKNRKLEDAALAYYVKHGNHMGKVDARDGYKAGYKAKEEEAMQDAIGFSEWCGDNYEIFTSTGRWRIRGAENEEEASKIYATEQLYKLWKKK